MVIAVKSEIDSRILVYPLMKACKTYGSVLVVSSNKYLKRLIDDEDFSTFRNMSVLIDTSGASDELYQEYGINFEDFDFVILDNMGVTDYDKCVCLFGSRQSSLFEEDKKLLEESDEVDKIVFVQFGTGTSKSKAKPEKKSRERKNEGVDSDDNSYNPADKFRNRIEAEKKKNVTTYTASFPTFEDIERVEGAGRFYKVDDKMISILYNVLNDNLHIEMIEFRKGVRMPDEDSNSVKSKRANR